MATGTPRLMSITSASSNCLSLVPPGSVEAVGTSTVTGGREGRGVAMRGGSRPATEAGVDPGSAMSTVRTVPSKFHVAGPR
eukprot:5182626-Prymnesium_polylepis.1